jgi:transcriptional antiterminator NusG
MMGEADEAALEPQLEPEATGEMEPVEASVDVSLPGEAALAVPPAVPELKVEPLGEPESEPDLEPELDLEAEPKLEPEPVRESEYRPLESLEPDAAIEAATERFLAPLAAPPAAAPARVEQTAELGSAGEEPDDGRRWYVVHCYSGYEAKVRHNLEQRVDTMGMKNKIFDVVIPTEEEIEVKDGKRRTVERHVFPGYILVQMLMDEDSWYVVRNTPGVTGFVGMGNEPTPLRPEEVAQIIRRMEAEAPRVKVTYKAGQRVRIIDGPFNDFIGTVDEIDMERAKVRVMVSFFGRETPVELDFLQVEKA